jgi:toxin ParE1/3/4
LNAHLTSASQADLSAALRWYRRRGGDLDRRFLRAFDAAIESIGEHPEIGQTIGGGIRRYLLRGFPYAVFYIIRGEKVVVLACLHGARDPGAGPRGAE